MNVERDFLGVRGPSFVAEAVDVFAVRVRVERVILRRDGVLVVLTVTKGVLDLFVPITRERLYSSNWLCRFGSLIWDIKPPQSPRGD